MKRLKPAAPLAGNAARIVEVRLGELRSFAADALTEANSGDQHNMRIAAKRLRYVLEATGFCFGAAGADGLGRARDIQEVLGEIHDCDEMLPRVERHLAELRERDSEAVRRTAGDADDLDPALSAEAPSRSAYRGLEVLVVHLTARRHLLFERFTALWSEIESEGTWDRLLASSEGLGSGE